MVQVAVPTTVDSRIPSTRKLWIASSLLVGTIAIYLALAFWNRDVRGVDLERFYVVAEAILAGGSPLDFEPIVYTFPPVWMYFERLALSVSRASGIPFTIAIKFPSILATALIAASIYLITGSGLWGLAFTVSPIVLALSTGGQFTALVLLPMLWSLELVERERYALAGLLAGVAIAVKFYPIAFVGVITLYLWRQRRVGFRSLAAFAGLAPLVWLGVTLPFVLMGEVEFLTRPILYVASGAVTDLGIIEFLKNIEAPVHGLGPSLPGFWGWLISRGKLLLGMRILLGTFTVFGLLRYQFTSAKEYLVFFLIAFYPLSGGVGNHYLAWILPFAYSLKRRDALLFAVVGGLAGVARTLAAEPAIWLVPIEPQSPFWMRAAAWTNGLFVAFCLAWLAFTLHQLEQRRRADSIEPAVVAGGAGQTG